MMSSPAVKAVLQRLMMAMITLLLLSIIIFFTLSLLTGDAASARLAGKAGQAQIAALRHQLGLDDPLIWRYLSWLKGVIQGDLGVSYISAEPVSALLLERGKNSLLMGGITLLLLVILSLVAGVFSGLRQGSRADKVISGLALTLLGIPSFVTGTLLILLFSFTLRWFPALSMPHGEMSISAVAKLLALPVLTLLSVSLAQNIRLIRAGVMSVSAGEACHMARLNGFSEIQVISYWILPVAVINYLPVLARYISGLISGALIAETLFAWPGLASSLLAAMQSRDIPVVMAISMAVCLVTVTVNALADMAGILLNPALRRSL